MKTGTPQHRIPAPSLVSLIAGVALIGSMAAGWAGAQCEGPRLRGPYRFDQTQRLPPRRAAIGRAVMRNKAIL